MPPGGFAQCSVWSTGSRWGRKLPLPVTSWLTQVTCTGRLARASIVYPGVRAVAPLLAAAKAKIEVGGKPEGRICWETCREPMAYRSMPPLVLVAGIAGGMNSGVTYFGMELGFSVPPGTAAAVALLRRASSAAGTS